MVNPTRQMEYLICFFFFTRPFKKEPTQSVGGDYVMFCAFCSLMADCQIERFTPQLLLSSPSEKLCGCIVLCSKICSHLLTSERGQWMILILFFFPFFHWSTHSIHTELGPLTGCHVSFNCGLVACYVGSHSGCVLWLRPLVRHK